MPRWITNDQRSGLWLKERIGTPTASRAADAFATTKKGMSASVIGYIKQLIEEREKNMARELPVTAAMQRGIDMEPYAKERFEELTGLLIQDCGFALHDEIDFGASPDGLIGRDGLIEIKCPESTTHIGYILDNQVPEQYIPQMMVQLAVTGRKYCWFMSYDDRFPRGKDVFLKKLEPTQAEIEKTLEQMRQFCKMLEATWESYLINLADMEFLSTAEEAELKEVA